MGPPRAGSSIVAAAVSAGLLLGVTSSAGASVPPLPFPSTPTTCGQYAGAAPQHTAAALGLPLAPSGTPRPQTIVVIEFDNAPNLAAVNGTLQACGLPAINPTIVNDPNNPPGPSLDNNGEPDLDLAVIGASLPANANLVLVNTSGGNAAAFALAAQQCGVTINPDPAPGSTTPSVVRTAAFPAGGCIISISYAAPETTLTQQQNGQTVLNSLTQTASDLLADLVDIGVVVVGAAGDNGPGGCQSASGFGSTALTPAYPASDPSVLAVGGTQWTSQASTTGTATAQYIQNGSYTPYVWRQAYTGPPSSGCANFTLNGQPAEGSAGGGGISAVFSAPANGAGAANAAAYPTLPQHRMIPDVAALAGWPGYALMIANAAGAIGWSGEELGTSAAAPAVAVGIANVNAVLTARGLAPISAGKAAGPRDVHAVFYNGAYSSAMTDITLGTSSLFNLTMNGIVGWSALPGFDMASGMGTPNFAILAAALVGAGTRAELRKAAATEPASSVALLGGGVRMDTGTPSTPPQKLLVRRPTATLAAAPVGRSKTILWTVPTTRVRPSTRYTVAMRIGGTWVALGKVRSTKAGDLTLPTLRFDRVGHYPIRLSTAGAVDRYLSLAVTTRP